MGKRIEQEVSQAKVKKAKTPYICFIEKTAGSLKSSNPGIEAGSIMKKAAEIWKNMNEDQRAPFVALAE